MMLIKKREQEHIKSTQRQLTHKDTIQHAFLSNSTKIMFGSRSPLAVPATIPGLDTFASVLQGPIQSNSRERVCDILDEVLELLQ